MTSLALPLPCPAQRSPCDTLLLKLQLPRKNSCSSEVLQSCSIISTTPRLQSVREHAFMSTLPGLALQGCSRQASAPPAPAHISSHALSAYF